MPNATSVYSYRATVWLVALTNSSTGAVQSVMVYCSAYTKQYKKPSDKSNGSNIATGRSYLTHQRLRSRSRDDSREMLRPRGRLRFSSRSLERECEL